LPHMFLLLDPGKDMVRARINEPSGRLITYRAKYKGKSKICLQPSVDPNCYTRSYRDNPRHNRLHLDYKRGEAILYLADGSQRIYAGEPRSFLDKVADYIPVFSKSSRTYLLQKEIDPSGLKTVYRYSDDGKIVDVLRMNPQETKVFSSACLEEKKRKIRVTTSDKQQIVYQADEQLSEIKSSKGPTERFKYKQINDRTETAYLTYLGASSNRPPLHIEYYSHNDMKVKKVVEAGVQIASFTYHSDYTDVLNADDILTRYHHNEGFLTKIEYFDKNDRLYSSQKFVWDQGRLVSRAMCSADGSEIVAKHMVYDSCGDLVEETISAEESY